MIDDLILKLANEQIVDYNKVRREVYYLEGRKFRNYAEQNGYSLTKSFFYSAIGEKRKEYKLKNEIERNANFLDYVGWSWRDNITDNNF